MGLGLYVGFLGAARVCLSLMGTFLGQLWLFVSSYQPHLDFAIFGKKLSAPGRLSCPEYYHFRASSARRPGVVPKLPILFSFSFLPTFLPILPFSSRCQTWANTVHVLGNILPKVVTKMFTFLQPSSFTHPLDHANTSNSTLLSSSAPMRYLVLGKMVDALLKVLLRGFCLSHGRLLDFAQGLTLSCSASWSAPRWYFILVK